MIHAWFIFEIKAWSIAHSGCEYFIIEFNILFRIKKWL